MNVNLFFGDSLPPADSSGASDPFITVKCNGEMINSETKYATLNPAFYKTLELKVRLPKELPSKFNFLEVRISI